MVREEKGQTPVRLSQKAKRAKVKRALVKKKKKAEMKLFMAEVKARQNEGYSVRQLMRSVVPEIGCEVKVTDAEITKAMRGKAEVVSFLLRSSRGHIRNLCENAALLRSFRGHIRNLCENAAQRHGRLVGKCPGMQCFLEMS